jgi:hypothetical protein
MQDKIKNIKNIKAEYPSINEKLLFRMSIEIEEMITINSRK